MLAFFFNVFFFYTATREHNRHHQQCSTNLVVNSGTNDLASIRDQVQGNYFDEILQKQK